jgi:NAD+ kinase
MTHIGLMPNPTKDPDFTLSRQISDYLIGLGATVYTEEAYRGLAPDNVVVLPSEKMMDICECLIAVGGDGTLLRIAQPAAHLQKPILGINYGKIGYMAELEYHEYRQLNRLLSNDFKIEDRAMLHVSVVRDNEILFESLALNDAVISSSAITRLIDMEVTANGQDIATYSADGLIVSTPTGSTGYSLSAGGPVLEPTSDALILTPVCPHTLGTRPIVFASDSIIDIKLIQLIDKDAHLTVDGYQRLPLRNGDVVKTSRAVQVTKLIKIKDLNFYHILNHKLGNGDKQK